MTRKNPQDAFQDHILTLNNNYLIKEVKSSYDCLSNKEQKLYKLGFLNGYRNKKFQGMRNIIIEKKSSKKFGKTEKQLIGFSFYKPSSSVIESIINKVCIHCEVNKKELMITRSRKQDICRARNILFNIFYEKYNMSLTRIGEIFGNDHTTVLHAIEMKRNSRRFWSPEQTLWKEFEDIKNTIS